MIIVTGANGPFGRLVTERLLDLVPAARVAVSVRDPQRAAGLGVAVRQADFGRSDTLPAAFAGADTVLVNGTYYGAAPEVRGPQLRGAIAAAVAAGARRVVVTGWTDTERSTLASTADFAGTERAVRALPVAWTIVRVGYGLAAALARDVLAARRDGVLTAPAGDARLAVGAAGDQAEATAHVLAAEAGEHDGRTYDLTGPDAIGWDELAQLAGPGIQYRPEPAAAFRDRAVAKGFPPAAADQLLALYASIRAGWANTPTVDLATLLGRPPVTAREAVVAAVEAWAW
ncbi:NAD(P)H-binding protein [Dactylosporangium vinaceum]|uniref:NAD(P)H-binding protein n=1 Tax=Dactylosporangium vinaceum TaxID=53362 RepID=A0ABV5MJG7_9ACTN|nr:NAD(P)H-binding protein [Dactylosporangium vinaceum]UAB93592.1 NAD(P)H-binding protein [Dactylosporangium vinaceum]